MNRQPKGIPVGGQFAEHERSDDDVMLTAPDVLDETPAQSHRVLTSHMHEVRHRVELANRRLARAGIADRFTIDADEAVVEHKGRLYAVTDFSLNEPKIGHDGWTVDGVFDFTPDGIPIAAYKSGTDVPEPQVGVCDQCGTRRRRERVFIVRHENGDTKQIGRSCLGAFLGIKPQGLWALEFDPNEREASDAGDEDDEFWLSSAGSADQVFPAEDLVLAAVVASDNDDGFVSRNRASMQTPATVDVVLGSFDTQVALATDTHRERAAAVLDFVRNLPEDSDQNYLVNLRRVLVGTDGVGGSFVRRKHAAIATSAVSAYQRHLDGEARRAAAKEREQAYTPGFLAAPNEKVADVEATVDFISHGEHHVGYNQVRPYTVVAMTTADGHRVTWIASSFKDVAVGQKVNVSGTVKKHEQRERGERVEDVTLLTRAKLIDPDSGDVL